MQAAEQGGPVLLPSDPENMRPARFPPTREASYLLPRANTAIRMPLPMRRPGWPGIGEIQALHRAETLPREEEESAAVARSLVYRVPDSREKAAAVDRFAALMYAGNKIESDSPAPEGDAVALPLPAPVPAWLSGPEDKEPDTFLPETEIREPSSLPESLEGSRGRMASRRFGLNQAAQGGKTEAQSKERSEPLDETLPPLLMVFSKAGGVGKTSLVATLGRALSYAGMSVLMADTAPHGLLPFYYGMKEGQRAATHCLQIPKGRPGVPVKLFSTGVERATSFEELKLELVQASEGASCILLDTSHMTSSAIGSLATANTRVLVLLAPDMNSVITLNVVEKLFADLASLRDLAVEPVYLLVGFDSAEALHLDVREVLRQELGERLLPFVIRRSSAVAEALAEGMTVIDYAPESAVASDYMAVAEWVCRKPAETPLSRQGTLWNEP